MTGSEGFMQEFSLKTTISRLTDKEGPVIPGPVFFIFFYLFIFIFLFFFFFFKATLAAYRSSQAKFESELHL